ncbi:unnamed protein product, partial [Ixodes pacificus]
SLHIPTPRIARSIRRESRSVCIFCTAKETQTTDAHSEGFEPLSSQGRRLFLFGFPLCERCACNVRVSLSVEVNCTGRGLSELPPALPLGTKVLVLARNHIKSLAMPAEK